VLGLGGGEGQREQRAHRHAGDGDVVAGGAQLARRAGDLLPPGDAIVRREVVERGAVSRQQHAVGGVARRGDRLAERSHLVGRGAEAVHQDAGEPTRAGQAEGGAAQVVSRGRRCVP
jgi:hypothetical protein